MKTIAILAIAFSLLATMPVASAACIPNEYGICTEDVDESVREFVLYVRDGVREAVDPYEAMVDEIVDDALPPPTVGYSVTPNGQNSYTVTVTVCDDGVCSTRAVTTPPVNPPPVVVPPVNPPPVNPPPVVVPPVNPPPVVVPPVNPPPVNPPPVPNGVCFTYEPRALTNACVVVGSTTTGVPTPTVTFTSVNICIIGAETCRDYPVPVLGIGNTNVPTPRPSGYVEATAACSFGPCRVTLP